jgi:hypothetical protein
VGRWLRHRYASIKRRPLTVSVDEDIHLLADKQGKLAVLDPVNDLQNARVHSLGAIAGKRFLGHNKRFEPHEGERCFQIRIAANGPTRLSFPRP